MEKVNMVPGFILKLWKMINDPQCDDLIAWTEEGKSFLILDPPRFAHELSKYFKHNNLSSFIRQLNMYGFRKHPSIENSGLHSGSEDLHFYHNSFVRDRPELLEQIKRKLPQKLSDNVDLRNVYKGITEIEDKQKDVSKTLADLKRENEMLWAELHDLRQKHQQQQLYITRLMKLVFEAMEQNGIKTNMLALKRNPPLMIEGSTAPLETTQATTILVDPHTLQQDLQSTTSATIDQAQDEEITLNTPMMQDQLTATSVESGFQTSNEQLRNMEQEFTIPASNVEAQVDSAEFQIDTLVPSIMDFTEENMDNFFSH